MAAQWCHCASFLSPAIADTLTRRCQSHYNEVLYSPWYNGDVSQCHINSALMTPNGELNRAPLTLLSYFSLSRYSCPSVCPSPDCPVCSGNLCGEIRPHDRGLLQEGRTSSSLYVFRSIYSLISFSYSPQLWFTPFVSAASRGRWTAVYAGDPGHSRNSKTWLCLHTFDHEMCLTESLTTCLSVFRSSSQQWETCIWRMARALLWFTPSRLSPPSTTFKTSESRSSE